MAADRGRPVLPSLRFGAVCAGVLLEALLSDPVKCEHGKGALKARGDKTPTAVRAAPDCESFILSPDHASRHVCTPWFCLEQALPPGREGSNWGDGARKVNRCLRNNFVTISHEVLKRPSN
jgi:hypothetical protein